MTAVDLAAVIVTIVCLLVVAVLVLAVMSLIRTVRELRLTVDQLRGATLPMVDDLATTVARAGDELERVDGLIDKAREDLHDASTMPPASPIGPCLHP